MKNNVLKLIAVCLFLFSAVSKGFCYENGDFQIWNTEIQEFKVNKELKVAFDEEFRWGENASELYYWHFDAGLFYDINKYLNFGGGWREIYGLVKGKFHPESAPYGTVTLSLDVLGFKFDDRNRLEGHDYDYKDDAITYRNKLGVKLPWKFTSIDIQPYASEEIFVSFGGASRGFNQNRFSSGFSIKIIENLKAELYYMLQSSKPSKNWINSNILGTKLKLVF